MIGNAWKSPETSIYKWLFWGSRQLCDLYTSLTICHPPKKLFKSRVESDNQNKSQQQTSRVTQTTYHISIEWSGRGWNVGFPQPCWTTLILDSWEWKCVNQFQLRHVITKIEHSKTSHINKNNDVPQTNQKPTVAVYILWTFLRI